MSRTSYGLPGLTVEEMPPVEQPVHGTIGYHVRSGKHDVTMYDWEQNLRFADRHLKDCTTCVPSPLALDSTKRRRRWLRIQRNAVAVGSGLNEILRGGAAVTRTAAQVGPG